MHQQHLQNQRLAFELRNALHKGEMEIWLQPQFDASGEEVTGAEALVRWNHPRLGIVMPNTFLPIAQNLDLMPAIDRFALRKGLELAKMLADAGYNLPRLSVNISFSRLNDESLLRDVEAFWSDTSTRLVFELVETVTYDGEASASLRHTLEQLRELGVALEVDDFGTGHASITALLQVAPDFVKIDQTLVANLCKDETCYSLVGAMVEMVKAINVGVIAEGVETAAQARCLKDLGCSHLQGFFFARPMPVEAFMDFLSGFAPITLDTQAIAV